MKPRQRQTSVAAACMQLARHPNCTVRPLPPAAAGLVMPHATQLAGPGALAAAAAAAVAAGAARLGDAAALLPAPVDGCHASPPPGRRCRAHGRRPAAGEMVGCEHAPPRRRCRPAAGPCGPAVHWPFVKPGSRAGLSVWAGLAAAVAREVVAGNWWRVTFLQCSAADAGNWWRVTGVLPARLCSFAAPVDWRAAPAADDAAVVPARAPTALPYATHHPRPRSTCSCPPSSACLFGLPLSCH